MTELLRHVSASSIIAGFDFSTGAVKGLAIDLGGQTLAEVRLPTDLCTEGGVSELNLMQLEGQARAAVRLMAASLRDLGRLDDWAAIGISATHHTSGRIDDHHVQVRRAICWNDQTLAGYHAKGLARLGGQDRARELIGGPWAIRYTLSHLVKDEEVLTQSDWNRTRWIAQHGTLAAGYITNRFDVVSVSSAASTGLMDLRTNRWCPPMLEALAVPHYRGIIEQQLPRIVDFNVPIGPLADHVAQDARLGHTRPLVFPSSDDQQAGLAGAGAVNTGELAIILGNSAVVNSSSDSFPQAGSNLDTMRLSWGPYLWMRCYNNGAQFLDRVVGTHPDWAALEAAARSATPGCGGFGVLPFVFPEPSLGVNDQRYEWTPSLPTNLGVRFRAALEALAFLIALGVREHERAGQHVSRITVSGGIAKSGLMVEILAAVIGRPLDRLVSTEGPSLGAAAIALAGLESNCRRQHGDSAPNALGNAVFSLVKFRDHVAPHEAWRNAYEPLLEAFERRLSPM